MGRIIVDYARIAERLSFSQQAVLVAHIDALASQTAEPTNPRNPAYWQAINRLAAIGLLRFCGTSDGPPNPQRTVLTDHGREVLAAMLAQFAAQWSCADEGYERRVHGRLSLPA
jgi:hypothetical protein